MRTPVLTLFLVACPSPRSAPPADPVPAEEPVQVAAPEPEPEPEPPPPPPLPVSPQGVTIQPCPDAAVPGMHCVPGGPFTRGIDGEHACDEYEVKWSKDNASPAATVWLSSYYLDETEVTFGAYQACVQAGDCPARLPNYHDFRRDDVPMTGLSWFEARTYCQAQGKRLPTEAEFERAARGPDGALHPWGDEPADCDKAVIMGQAGRGCGTPKRGSHPDKGRPLAVGSRPKQGDFHDLIGNAEEWVADWYQPYAECGEHCLGTDPKGPCAGQDTCAHSETRLVKGGSWYWGPACATGYNRRHHFPKNQPYHHFGFRCAASLDQASALASAGTAGPSQAADSPQAPEIGTPADQGSSTPEVP